MTGPKPPRGSTWWLRLLSSQPSRGLEGDLFEEFNTRVVQGESASAARRRYRNDVLRASPALLRLLISPALKPGAAGVGIALLWFACAYFALATWTGGGTAPLGNLDDIAFLALWVFGAAAAGGAASGRIRPSSSALGGLAVGVFVGVLVVAGIDEPLGYVHALRISAVAFGGALLGASAGAASTRGRRIVQT